MAETWRYALYWTLPNNAQMPGDYTTIPLTIKRITNTDKDGSFYKLASDSASFWSNVEVKTWGVGGLTIGSFGSTDNISEDHSSGATVSTTLRNIPEAILNINGTATNTSISRTSSNTTVYIYGSTQGPQVFTFDVSVEYKYSASTCTVGSVNFGSNSTVTLNNTYISDLWHTVKWTVGSRSKSVNTSTGANSATTEIDSAWMDQSPNSTYVVGSVEVKTYKGQTQIGSATTATFTVNVPATVVPSLASVTATIKDENQGIPGTYIQNTTGVYLQINGASAGTGATLPADTSHYVISANVEETYVFDSVNIKYTINRLANCGEITFTVTVIDSRGRRSSPKYCTINVMEYALPVISSATAYRCRQDGIAAEDGTYACIRIMASYTETGGNTMDIDSKYYDTLTPTTLITAQNDMTPGVSYIIGNGLLNTERTYHVKFIVTDSLGNVINKDIVVQSATYAIHVKNGGSGVAFGKTSEYDNSVEINDGWDLYYKGNIMPLVFYYVPTVQHPTPPNPQEGWIWLQPKT